MSVSTTQIAKPTPMSAVIAASMAFSTFRRAEAQRGPAVHGSEVQPLTDGGRGRIKLDHIVRPVVFHGGSLLCFLGTV